MYAITATVNGRQVPTFYLHPNVQGIMSEEQACVIAAEVLNPTHNPTLKLSICAVKISIGVYDE